MGSFKFKGGVILSAYCRLDKLYESLEKTNDVIVVDAPFLKATKALTYIDNDQFCWIALNKKAISSVREELCILQEEKAHYDVGIIPNNYLSNSYSDRIVRERNEYKAKRKAVETLIPKEKLLNVMKELPTIYIEALADAFDVTSDFMADALKIYGYDIF